MRELLERQANLFIKQAEVTDVLIDDISDPNDPATRRVRGLKLRDGREILAASTVITTGTFLNGPHPLR